MENKIRTSLDRVNPDGETRVRMYRNIMKKAEAAERKTDGKPCQPRILRIAVSAAACICAGAVIIVCNLPPHEKPTEAPENPEYVSEVKEALKDRSDISKVVNLNLPDAATDREYLYGSYATEMTFSLEGREYLVRVAVDKTLIFADCPEMSHEITNDGDVSSVTPCASGRIMFWRSGGAYYSLSSGDAAEGELEYVSALMRGN